MQNKKYILAFITAILVIALSLFFFSDQINKIENDAKENITISSAFVDDENNAVVEYSNGKKMIAGESVKFSENNFAEVKNYRDGKISPNNMFVAFEGSGFEEEFIAIFSAENSQMYPVIYGQSGKWLDDGKIQIQSCNLANENCSVKQSISSEQPWITEIISEDPSQEVSTSIRDSFNSEIDFFSAIESTPDLSKFSQAVTAGGQFIRGTGPFTILAPTNEAFQELPTETFENLLLPENQDQLQSFLRNYIIVGDVSYSELLEKESVDTLGDSSVDIFSESGSITLNGEGIITDADLPASNGRVHVINFVINN